MKPDQWCSWVNLRDVDIRPRWRRVLDAILRRPAPKPAPYWPPMLAKLTEDGAGLRVYAWPADPHPQHVAFWDGHRFTTADDILAGRARVQWLNDDRVRSPKDRVRAASVRSLTPGD